MLKHKFLFFNYRSARVFNQLLVLLVLSIFFTTIGCSSLFYFPTKRTLVYRDRLPLQPEDIYFNSSDGTRLHGWHFSALNRNSPKAIIVHFHGNAQNLTSHFISLYEAPSRGYAYFIFDYRGYGQSAGRPYPKGTVEDGKAAIRWAQQKYPGIPLVLFGQSLGGAISLKAAVEIKSEIPLALIVADSTFSDYRSAARKFFAQSWILFPFQPLVWAFADNSAAPKERLHELSPIPLLVVHGDKDNIVDMSLGKEIFNLAKDPKELWIIPGGQHIDFTLRENGKYAEKFYQFLDSRFEKK